VECVYPKTFFDDACSPREANSLHRGLSAVHQSAYRYTAWETATGVAKQSQEHFVDMVKNSTR